MSVVEGLVVIAMLAGAVVIGIATLIAVLFVAVLGILALIGPTDDI
jgi:hypothetical protein